MKLSRSWWGSSSAPPLLGIRPVARTVVAVHEPQPVGILGVADQPVRTMGFEQVMVMRAHAGELARIECVAVPEARVEVVDLEAASGV